MVYVLKPLQIFFVHMLIQNISFFLSFFWNRADPEHWSYCDSE